MKRGFFVITVFFSLLVLGIFLAGCTSTPPPLNTTPSIEPTPVTTPALTGNGSSGDVSESAVVAANNRFAHDMYRQLSGDPQSAGNNIFFSPLSISSALAITYEGARGTTADQIRSVFSFPSNTATLRDGFSLVNTGINSGNAAYNLSTANALWAEKTYQFLPDYINTAGHWYSAHVTNLDFIGEPETSRQTINTWVANRTNDKIQNLLPTGSIGSATRLVITNAVYFKGTWEKHFDANDTQDADFHVSPQKTVSVKMMQRTDVGAVYPYEETADLQVLSMPYAYGTGSGLSMIVLLPKNNSFAAAEATLDPRNLSALEQSLSSRRVMVYFPKFKLDTQYHLSGTLATMGMPDAFASTADFSGMDGKRDLYISDVVHKAYIDVNEEGTEAAAATAVVMVGSAMPPGHEEPIPVFRADHPFLFLIQDNDTGAIIFAGRIDNPNGT